MSPEKVKSPPEALRILVRSEILAAVLAAKLVFRPSFPVALAFAAAAGFSVLGKLLRFYQFSLQKALIRASEEAAKSHESALRSEKALETLEGRIVRLENRDGFRRQ